ncbi:MAG TPA: acyl-CoA dehydrogenase family protein [Candidatus Kapabacteria bacterium]|nr:acyl-CoA dehydrogenase family protein [Candidatus Kapabacteria bacterium]
MSLYRNLTQEQVVLRDTVRRFAEEYINPVVQELDEKEQFSIELTKKIF